MDLDPDIRVLSLTQPWLDAILAGGKRIENREKWKGCAYRGQVLLHASSKMTRANYIEVAEWTWAMRMPWRPPTIDRVATGAVLGIATIDGVVRNAADFAAYEAGVLDAADQRQWWFGGFALVLKDVRPLTSSILYKNGLGLRRAPPYLLAKVRERLGA